VANLGKVAPNESETTLVADAIIILALVLYEFRAILIDGIVS
jgi:hypothetical protein